ncbi:hypothetical protein ACTZWW_03150 [Salinarimonas sp. NSM]|uniref:hypothetical protein n=1 Tax=Salinarimonas sp. NSM TaxID=3458003 RepID=UPI0040365FC5
MYRRPNGTECDATEALDGRGALRDGFTIGRRMMMADAAPSFAGDRLTVADLAKVGSLPATVPPGVVTEELQDIARRLAAVPNRAEAESIMHAVEIAHATIRVGLERDRQFAARGQIAGTPAELEAEFRGKEAALAWLETVHSVLKGATQGLRDARHADATTIAQARADAAYDAGRDDLSNAWRR